MNVSQLEAALDLPRASIRFYEKEGLLSPERLANGYRDYSEADLETLRRIKLLRALGLPLEDIKALQAGELRLSDALRAQEERLRREAAEREAARTLCRAMELEGAEYATLDAGRYLEELDKLGETGVTLTPPAADSLPVVRHPWRRYLARLLDHSLCVLLLDALLVFTLRFTFGEGLLITLVQSYLAWGVQFLLEPHFLSTWGTTPGKWIFGLKVRNAHGGKLTFREAAARLSALFGYGEGWCLPGYQLYRNYKSYRACDDGEILPWDEGLSYTIRDESGLRGVAWAGAMVLEFGLIVLLGLQLIMPPVRRPLMIGTFAENYNDVLRQYDLNGLTLDMTGNWVVPQGTASLGNPPPIFHYETTEDGILTGVSFTYEREPDYFWDGAETEQTAAFLAMLAAQPEAGLFNWLSLVDRAGDQIGSSYEDYQFTLAGLTVTNEVAYSGYRPVGGFLLPEEGAEQTYSQHFSISVAAE